MKRSRIYWPLLLVASLSIAGGLHAEEAVIDLLPVWNLELFSTESFEWSNGRLVGWRATDKDLIAPSSEAGPTGSQTVEFKPPAPKTYNSIVQPLSHPQLAGGQVTLETTCKASERDVALLVLRYRLQGSEQDVLTYSVHPGSGQWQDLALRAEVPENVDPSSVQLRITLRPGATQPLFVSAASARLTGTPKLESLGSPGPGFEAGAQPAAEWSTRLLGPTRWMISADGGRNGTAAASIETAGLETDWVVELSTGAVPVQTGDFVAASYWSRNEGPTEAALTARLEVQVNGKWQKAGTSAGGPGTGSWLKRTLGCIAPAEASGVRLVLATPASQPAGVRWLVDDAETQVVSFRQYAGRQEGRRRRRDATLYAVDTLRQDYAGCYGDKKSRTPNIDRLAAEGRRYRRVVSTAPWTKPSFGSILTSLYPSQHGAYDIERPLKVELTTLAEALHEKGYFCAGFVYSNCDGFLGSDMNYSQGFDLYFQGNEETVQEIAPEFLTQNNDALKGLNGGGIFLFYHNFTPHSPYYNPDPQHVQNQGLLGTVDINTPDHLRPMNLKELAYNEKDVEYIQTVYRLEVDQTDRQIGELTDLLKAADLYEDMALVFCADHGEMMGEKAIWGHGLGYRPVYRTPMIIRAPGKIKPGKVDKDSRVSNLDVMPTLLDLEHFNFACIR